MNCAPTLPASGHWATATARAPSPTRRTTTTRSSLPTCSTTTHDVFLTGSSVTVCSPIRLCRIGITEQEARESGRRVLIGKRMMTRVGHARERSETDGFIKILVDADSEQILAAILGIGGDEVVHTLLTAMYAKLPYTVVSRAVHIHPTVAELTPTVLQDLEPWLHEEQTVAHHAGDVVDDQKESADAGLADDEPEEEVAAAGEETGSAVSEDHHFDQPCQEHAEPDLIHDPVGHDREAEGAGATTESVGAATSAAPFPRRRGRKTAGPPSRHRSPLRRWRQRRRSSSAWS
ncbi:MAG: hypothetical protein VCF24_09835 [Candidatus Latescibacterota bacterium]